MSERKPITEPPECIDGVLVGLPPSSGSQSDEVFRTMHHTDQSSNMLPKIARAPSEQSPVPPILGAEKQTDDAESILIAIGHAPPWLISLVVHMVVMIVLAMLMVPTVLNRSISMEATFFVSCGVVVKVQLV